MAGAETTERGKGDSESFWKNSEKVCQSFSGHSTSDNMFSGKKEAAQKAEADFFALLKEHVFIAQGMPWKEVCINLITTPNSVLFFFRPRRAYIKILVMRLSVHLPFGKNCSIYSWKGGIHRACPRTRMAHPWSPAKTLCLKMYQVVKKEGIKLSRSAKTRSRLNADA